MATTKKTTKVQTPVDERETFVSLQKIFAENEQSSIEKVFWACFDDRTYEAYQMEIDKEY